MPKPKLTISTDWPFVVPKVWCVQHAEGWCATYDEQSFEENIINVGTRCGHYVTFPLGCAFREPTCPSCRLARSVQLKFVCDKNRHLVCLPFSIENLHTMAEHLGIKRGWFHRNHYDIPKRRVMEVQALCAHVLPSRDIVTIIKYAKQTR